MRRSCPKMKTYLQNNSNLVPLGQSFISKMIKGLHWRVVDFTFIRNNNNNKNKNLTKKNYLYSYKLLGNALWGLF